MLFYIKRLRKSLFLFAFCLVLVIAPAGSRVSAQDLSLRVRPWPEAQALFRSDPRWLGGDGASSVDLGRGRVLWLFGDSLIDLRAPYQRRQADLVRNTCAVQTGYNPSRARLHYYWSNQACQPGAFYADHSRGWAWPVSGIRLGRILLVILTDICPSDNALGFEVCGSRAALVEDPDQPPSQWRIRYFNLPLDTGGPTIGSGGLVLENRHLYAFGTRTRGSHEAILGRWPLERVRRGELTDLQWWCGRDRGFRPAADRAVRPSALFKGGQHEYSVQLEPASGKYLLVQTLGFGQASVVVRWADRLTGPWSKVYKIYQPPEGSRPHVLVYAAKSHPELEGADLVLTYNVNSLQFDQLFDDPDLYIPRFLKVSLEP